MSTKILFPEGNMPYKPPGKARMEFKWKDSVGCLLVVIVGVGGFAGLLTWLDYLDKQKVKFATEAVEAAVRSPVLAELYASGKLPVPEKFGPDDFKVIRDLDHDCAYVLIGNSVWCWRGTNLLGVNNQK